MEPTVRDVGAPPDPDDVEPPRPLDLSWVDVHQHTGSLTWNDRERFDIGGCEAAVMIAAGYYWTPYRPVEAADVRFLWDDALRRARAFDARHFYDQRVAVGVHTWARVEGAADVLAALPEYCVHDRVVAVGETGIESTQHTAAWSLDEQRDVVREQFHVAREAGLPVLVHTPGSSKGDLDPRYAHSYEEGNRNFTEPLFGGPDADEDAKDRAVEEDLALVDEAGLADDRVVIDHAGEGVAGRVLEDSGCWLAFTVGAPWLRGVDARDVARTIERYGADRILIDSDLAGSMQGDPFVIPRTAMDLLRLGVDRADVRRVVSDNPKRVLGLD